MYHWILLFVCLVASTDNDTTPSVTPLFSCWFTSFANGQRLTNIVLGYVNTFNETQTITPTETTQNIILPANYNHEDYDTFVPGTVQNARVITDTLRVLNTLVGSIAWRLGAATVTVYRQDLSADNQCSLLYANACPTRIASFCSDGLYCDGDETCVPSLPDATLGTCTRPSQAVQCASGTVCSEYALGCVRAPPVAPTPAVATPTNEPTEQAETMYPTAPTTEAPPGDLVQETPSAAPSGDVPVADGELCVSDADCLALTTFCDGAFRCDNTSGQCVRANQSYDACATARQALKNTPGTAPQLTVVCVEARGCILVSQGDNAETVPTPVAPIAPSSSDNTAPIVIGSIALVLVVIALLLLLIVLWYEFSESGSYYSSRALGMTSLMARFQSSNTARFGNNMPMNRRKQA